MTREDQVFVADVMVTNPTQETMASSVITWLAGVIAKLSVIAKIRKYRELHEGHHFILMAMEVHGAFGHDMDRFIRECTRVFHNRWLKGPCLFFIQFFKHVNIVFQRVLIFAIEKKIVLVGDACFRPPIICVHVTLEGPWVS